VVFDRGVRVSDDAKPSQSRARAPEAREASKQRVVDAIMRHHGVLSCVARDVGVTRRAIELRIASDPEFWRPIVDDARASMIDTAEKNIYGAVETGDIGVSMWVLKTVGKSRGYSERTELTGPDGGDLVLTLRPPSRSADE
jgi:hypothetical protein